MIAPTEKSLTIQERCYDDYRTQDATGISGLWMKP